MNLRIHLTLLVGNAACAALNAAKIINGDGTALTWAALFGACTAIGFLWANPIEGKAA